MKKKLSKHRDTNNSIESKHRALLRIHETSARINTKAMTAIFVIIVFSVLVVLTLQLIKQGGQEPAMPGMSAGEQMENAQGR